MRDLARLLVVCTSQMYVSKPVVGHPNHMYELLPGYGLVYLGCWPFMYLCPYSERVV
jgi:hypothetical protein